MSALLLLWTLRIILQPLGDTMWITPNYGEATRIENVWNTAAFGAHEYLEGIHFYSVAIGDVIAADERQYVATDIQYWSPAGENLLKAPWGGVFSREEVYQMIYMSDGHRLVLQTCWRVTGFMFVIGTETGVWPGQRGLSLYKAATQNMKIYLPVITRSNYDSQLSNNR